MYLRYHGCTLPHCRCHTLRRAAAGVTNSENARQASFLRFGETSYDTKLRLPKPWEALSAPIAGGHHLFDLPWRPHMPIPFLRNRPAGWCTTEAPVSEGCAS